MAAPLATTVSDGTLAYGTGSAITINSVAYIAEDIDVRYPTNWIVTKNSLGVPNKQVGIADIPTGTATLQLLASSTAQPPLLGATFTMTPAGGVATLWWVTEVGAKQVSDGETKFNIAFRYAFTGNA